MAHVLDNPFWAALTTSHRHLAVGYEHIRRYPAEFGPFVAVADSRRTDPAEAACFRVDFEHWMCGLPARERQVVMALAEGERPSVVARNIGVSAGRLSQLRGELRASWLAFCGDVASA